MTTLPEPLDEGRGDLPEGAAIERALWRRLVDHRLTPEEFAVLEKQLLADAEYRARYVQYMDVEASLYEEMIGPLAPREAPHSELPSAASPSEPAPSDARRGNTTRRLALVLLATAATALVALAGSQYWRNNDSGQPDTARGPGSADQPLTGYKEIELQGFEPVAVVTHAEGLGPQRPDSKVAPGTRLKPGSLTLDRGKVQIEFLGGAKVLVQGPCELHVLSPKSATLVSGKAAARVLAWGQGFVLNTPETALVDLGTEFAVAVDDRQGNEVRVVDGEVEVSLLGADGNTLTSERVVEAGAVRVTPDGKALQDSDGSLSRGLSLFDRPTVPLAVPPAYFAAVRQSQPLLYWRFEETTEGRVPNVVGSELEGVLRGLENRTSDNARPPIHVENGALYLKESTAPRYLTTSQPIAGLNAQSFSLEMWANPDMFHWATLAAVVPEKDSLSAQHLNVLELAHQTNLVHQAGAFRFMHRHPPHVRGGVNLFTTVGCTPGQWHHLVAVKTPSQLTFFLNGRHKRVLAGAMGSDADTYQLFLGQLRMSSSERQFVGAIDEVAVYTHALDDSAVLAHYEAMLGSARTELGSDHRE